MNNICVFSLFGISTLYIYVHFISFIYNIFLYLRFLIYSLVRIKNHLLSCHSGRVRFFILIACLEHVIYSQTRDIRHRSDKFGSLLLHVDLPSYISLEFEERVRKEIEVESRAPLTRTFHRVSCGAKHSISVASSRDRHYRVNEPIRLAPVPIGICQCRKRI